MRVIRTIPAFVIAAALAVPVAAADAHAVESVRMGPLIASKVVATWQCQDTLRPWLPVGKRRTAVVYDPWKMKRHSTAFARAQLNAWTLRRQRCHRRLDRVKWEWNWQAFPSWVVKLANCETSVDWFAEGSSTDGTFYSAFNIGRTRYDGAAHHMGVRGWHEGHGVPSPYEQAQAVIGYVRTIGDGFTGRCAGIAKPYWGGASPPSIDDL